jgi:hypothetical protein
MAEETLSKHLNRQSFALHGWIGLLLVAVFWLINWTFPGPRTFWAFFPLWLGFCLTIDAINLRRTGSSLLARNWRRYIGLFLVSVPVWWLFEVLNWRIQSWHYLGRELLNNWQYVLVSSINFCIVIPAIFGAAELVSGLPFVQQMKPWLVINTDRKTTITFFLLGWIMMAALLSWPRYFFPFLWLSVYFILEPLNVWLGNRSLGLFTRRGDWRPVVSLFLGALLTGFFWEMWNFLAYPKWVYTVPFVGNPKIFEMPLLGYGGYLPFACELFAVYHLVTGFLGQKRTSYVLPAYGE